MVKNNGTVARLRNWYGKYERPISSLSLIGGFVFDALTLKRVDLFWENLWVVGHLAIVGVCIILIHSIENKASDDNSTEALVKAAANPSTAHFWLVNILQFFFGGILSTYLVFYFRSSAIATSWPFLLILGISFWANEALKMHFVRLIFQVSLFFLSVFSFAIFIIPVLLHKIGSLIFILSGAASLIVIGLFLGLLKFTAKKEFEESKNLVYISIAGIFILINVLYFTGLIPPIPLSLKTSGVYHSLYRNSEGNYVIGEERSKWQNYFHLYPDYHKASGEPVFIYSAIFSPSQLDTAIIHEWQSQNIQTGEWKTTNRFSLPIVGGRDGGFRTFSEKFNTSPGRWRVNVLSITNQVIGRIRFNIVQVNDRPALIEKIND